MADQADATKANSNETGLWFEVPEGNLTAIAEDTNGTLAIGIMSIFWTAWIVVSMLVSW